MIRQPVDRPLAVNGEAEIDIVGGFGQMAVQPSFMRRAAAITSFSSPGSSDQVGVVGASATSRSGFPAEVS